MCPATVSQSIRAPHLRWTSRLGRMIGLGLLDRLMRGVLACASTARFPGILAHFLARHMHGSTCAPRQARSSTDLPGECSLQPHVVSVAPPKDTGRCMGPERVRLVSASHQEGIRCDRRVDPWSCHAGASLGEGWAHQGGAARHAAPARVGIPREPSLPASVRPQGVCQLQTRIVAPIPLCPVAQGRSPQAGVGREAL